MQIERGICARRSSWKSWNRFLTGLLLPGRTQGIATALQVFIANITDVKTTQLRHNFGKDKLRNCNFEKVRTVIKKDLISLKHKHNKADL